MIVTGGPGEDYQNVMIDNMRRIPVFVAAGSISIRQLGAIFSCVNLVVSNSTGPLHIAAAVGTPVIGFYPQHTALSAGRWGPYTKDKIIFTPKGKPLDCNRCEKQADHACECMNSITVAEVVLAAQGLLRNKEASWSSSDLHFSGSTH